MTTISRVTIPTDYFKPFIHMIHPKSNIRIYKNHVEIVVLQYHTFIILQILLFFSSKTQKENNIVDESSLLQHTIEKHTFNRRNWNTLHPQVFENKNQQV